MDSLTVHGETLRLVMMRSYLYPKHSLYTRLHICKEINILEHV